MRGLKDFDRVYMPGMEGFLDSICKNGLSMLSMLMSAHFFNAESSKLLECNVRYLYMNIVNIRDHRAPSSL